MDFEGIDKKIKRLEKELEPYIIEYQDIMDEIEILQNKAFMLIVNKISPIKGDIRDLENLKTY
jgi:hypothetical protein